EPLHYNNNSDDSNFGKGMSYFTNVQTGLYETNSSLSNVVNLRRYKMYFSSSNVARYEMNSSSSNVANLRRNNTDNLIEFLTNDEEFTKMNIDENFFKKLYEEDIVKTSFIRLCKDDLKECGLKIGPSLELEDYISRLGWYTI
ncbi:2356_t:CDS:2, partial [Gigaspora rosea]